MRLYGIYDRAVSGKIYAERLFAHKVLIRIYNCGIKFLMQIVRNGTIYRFDFGIGEKLAEIRSREMHR